MADDVLFWKARRALIDLKKPAPAETLLQAGSRLAAEGYHVDALDFYKKAGNADKIAETASQAVAEGDFFLFSLALQLLGREPQAGELMELAANARGRGLLSYEKKAMELLEKDSAAAPDGADPGA
ncbi:MAG: hypothetical protein LBR53_10280 [Deltaproteobacteria bacterium]|jgi:hypothetical protein|nr:hypothetical protein [Deltaproteobacteria bacterium]